jgi:hypothetical protein
VFDAAAKYVSVVPYSKRFKIIALDCADAAPANSAAIPKLLTDGMVLEHELKSRIKSVVRKGAMSNGAWLRNQDG